MGLQRLEITDQSELQVLDISIQSVAMLWRDLWILLVFAGSALLCIANEAVDPLVVALLLLMVGFVVGHVVFQNGRYEMRAFLLCYSVCVMVAGLAQFYSISVFGALQSTIDSPKYLEWISPAPPFTKFDDMASNYKPRLAVVIWQQVYRLTWLLGLKFGPYIGVLFNGLVVGLSSSITVRTARELFGNDCWRLRRVGTLCACCGMFWLFGGLLLRDCFCLFFSVLALWALVHWLSKPTLCNLVLAIFAVGISAFAMLYLRWMTTVLYGFFCILALLCWLGQRGSDAKRLVMVFILVTATLVGFAYVNRYFTSLVHYRAKFAERYEAIGYESTSRGDDSLGMQLVLHQPLPVRLILGSGMLMVYPIPLWAFIEPGVREYHFIFSYNGIYQILIMPFLLAGVHIVFRTVLNIRKLSPLFFLTAYSLLNTAVVASTSLQLRHLAQFYPAFLILAALPDTRERQTKLLVKNIGLVWLAVVVLVHILWFVMRYTQ